MSVAGFLSFGFIALEMEFPTWPFEETFYRLVKLSNGDEKLLVSL